MSYPESGLAPCPTLGEGKAQWQAWSLKVPLASGPGQPATLLALPYG